MFILVKVILLPMREGVKSDRLPVPRWSIIDMAMSEKLKGEGRNAVIRLRQRTDLSSIAPELLSRLVEAYKRAD